jgi:hypothetical protein
LTARLPTISRALLWQPEGGGMTADKPSDIKCSREYWTYDLRGATSLKVERNLSQLAEWDDRLTPAARKILDFLIDWENDHHGDSLASLRHITAHLNARAPAGCGISKRTVEDGIARLLASGWIVRTRKGTGQKNASRYVIPADILTNAGLGKLPTVRDLADGSTVRNVADSTVRDLADGPALTVRTVTDKDTLTSDALKDACTDVVICIPQASPAAQGGVLAGFDALAAAYAKPGDNLGKARRAFLDINPDEAELARMVKAAESWRASAKGPRMALERWLKEKRWLSTEEFKQDNRPAHSWPACVITRIKPAAANDECTAKIWFRDRDGASRMQVLNCGEYRQLQQACAVDKKSVEDPSDDMHEFVGARFDLGEGGWFEPLNTCVTSWRGLTASAGTNPIRRN